MYGFLTLVLVLRCAKILTGLIAVNILIRTFLRFVTIRTKILQIKSQFGDFEEFAQTIQGWGLDFLQLDCGQFSADVHQIGTPEVLISEARFNRHLIQKGSQPREMRTFVIMAEDTSPFIWHKQEVTRDNFIVFPQGAELDAASLASFHVYTISILESMINERLQREEQSSPAALLKQGGVLKVKLEKVQALREFLKQVVVQTSVTPGILEQREYQQSLCDNLTEHIFDILNLGEKSGLTLRFSKKVRLIQSIEAWVEETNKAPNSMNELCKIFKANERTLRRAFKAWYGVSPQQFLLSIRLNKVRNDLCLSDDPMTKISDIANLQGFWHMGKFAYLYRRQFGELPSETLRRTM